MDVSLSKSKLVLIGESHQEPVTSRELSSNESLQILKKHNVKLLCIEIDSTSPLTDSHGFLITTKEQLSTVGQALERFNQTGDDRYLELIYGQNGTNLGIAEEYIKLYNKYHEIGINVVAIDKTPPDLLIDYNNKNDPNFCVAMNFRNNIMVENFIIERSHLKEDETCDEL